MFSFNLISDLRLIFGCPLRSSLASLRNGFERPFRQGHSEHHVPSEALRKVSRYRASPYVAQWEAKTGTPGNLASSCSALWDAKTETPSNLAPPLVWRSGRPKIDPEAIWHHLLFCALGDQTGVPGNLAPLFVWRYGTRETATPGNSASLLVSRSGMPKREPKAIWHHLLFGVRGGQTSPPRQFGTTSSLPRPAKRQEGMVPN